MYHVEIQFANRTESHSYAMRGCALLLAKDLLEMFKGEEMWFDNERNTYIVTVPQTEIV